MKWVKVERGIWKLEGCPAVFEIRVVALPSKLFGAFAMRRDRPLLPEAIPHDEFPTMEEAMQWAEGQVRATYN